MHQIEQELIDEINQYLDNYAFSSTADMSVEVLEQIFEYIKSNAEICTILLCENEDDNFRNQVMYIVRQQCISAWTLNKSLAHQDAEYIYAFAVAGSVGIIQKWLKDGLEKPSKEIAELVLKITNYGLYGFNI